GDDEDPPPADRHALRRYGGAVSAVYLHHRLRPGDAGFDPPRLRGRRIVPLAGFHAPHPAVLLAGDFAGRAGHGGADPDHRTDSDLQCAGEAAAAGLYGVRMPDPGRHLRHALERGDRRTTLLEELSG